MRVGRVDDGPGALAIGIRFVAHVIHGVFELDDGRRV